MRCLGLYLLQDMFLLSKHLLWRGLPGGKIWSLPWTCCLTCIGQLSSYARPWLRSRGLHVDSIKLPVFLNWFSFGKQLSQFLLVGTLPAGITSIVFGSQEVIIICLSCEVSTHNILIISEKSCIKCIESVTDIALLWKYARQHFDYSPCRTAFFAWSVA